MPKYLKELRLWKHLKELKRLSVLFAMVVAFLASTFVLAFVFFEVVIISSVTAHTFGWSIWTDLIGTRFRIRTNAVNYLSENILNILAHLRTVHTFIFTHNCYLSDMILCRKNNRLHVFNVKWIINHAYGSAFTFALLIYIVLVCIFAVYGVFRIVSELKRGTLTNTLLNRIRKFGQKYRF